MTYGNIFTVHVISVSSKSTKADPRWVMVDVQYVRMLKRFIPLSELKIHHTEHKTSGGPLKNIALFTRARLSVQPVSQGECSKLNTCTDWSRMG